MRPATSDGLSILQVGPTSDYPVSDLSHSISGSLPNIAIQTAPPLLDQSEAYDSRRDQYHSTRILVLLERRIEPPVGKLLGLTAFDLFVPGMNYVFGEARCPGQVAVVSTFRLRGPAGGEASLSLRVRKEAVHEVGHMFGLKHCLNKRCVMYFSKSLQDTDMKGDGYCNDCQLEFELSDVE